MTLSILLLRHSDSHPIFWCVIGLVAGLGLFAQGFRLLQTRHLILDTPVSKIRSASLGMVELSGLAIGPYTMVSPITERPCYYYRTVAWEWKREGRSSQWVKVAAECMHVPFFLDDNTGKVLVDPRGADLDLHRDFQEEFCDSFFTLKEEAPGNVRSFLSRHGISTSNKVKVEEFCIKPKNALFLLGTLHENSDLELTSEPIYDEEFSSLGARIASFSTGVAALRQTTLSFVSGGDGLSGILTSGLQHDPAYDEVYNKAISTASAQVIRLSPDTATTKVSEMTQQQKIAAALMKARIANPVDWAAAGITPSSLAQHQVPASPANGSAAQTPQPAARPAEDFPHHPPVVLMKGKNNPTFLISWRSQRDLARSLAWKCALMIWGGPALFLLSLYGLHVFTNWF